MIRALLKDKKGRVLFSLLIIFGIVLMSVSTKKVSDAAYMASVHMDNCPVIIIDAGHGGFDGGAVANDGTEEKNINLQIALKVDEFCMALGYNTLLVRDDDRAVNDVISTIRSKKVSDLQNRLKLMNEYDNAVYVSVHMNKYSTGGPKGAQVFYSPKTSETSKTLAISVQSSIIKYVQNNNKRVVKQGDMNIFLLYNATVPAIITECGFLSNSEDLANLKDEEYQSKLAFSIALGINEYFQTNNKG